MTDLADLFNYGDLYDGRSYNQLTVHSAEFSIEQLEGAGSKKVNVIGKSHVVSVLAYSWPNCGAQTAEKIWNAILEWRKQNPFVDVHPWYEFAH